MPPRQPTSQQGVVLIVVMIMLVIIGLTSAAVMRNALESDMISANVRSETAAMEAAQAALAYCEQKIIANNDSLFVIRAAPATGQPEQWANIDHWRSAGATGYYSPPNWDHASTESESSKAVIANAPQCMAEYVTPTSTKVVKVTARGFTPNYLEDSSGTVISGSTVWVQSTLHLDK